MIKRPPLALFAILMIAGFLLVVTANATSALSRTTEPRRHAIVSQILDQKKQVANLDEAINRESNALAEANEEAARISTGKRGQQVGEDLLALQSGTVAVKGDGVEVVLADAPRKESQGAAFDASRVQDKDLQLVVNSLFASGAEAVAINDNRVVAVTPIRAAGGTIVVNFRPVNSPYRIVAIGAERSRFVDSEISKHFALWKERYKLGFNVNSRRGLTAPAYSGRVAIDIAKSATPTTLPNVQQSAPSASRSLFAGDR